GLQVIGEGTIDTGVPAEWDLAGVGDFDGDGIDDLLWRQEDGTAYAQLMDGLTVRSEGVVAAVGPQWELADIADFDGDGSDDLLWHNVSGEAYLWTLDGLAIDGGGSLGTPTTDWEIIG